MVRSVRADELLSLGAVAVHRPLLIDIAVTGSALGKDIVVVRQVLLVPVRVPFDQTVGIIPHEFPVREVHMGHVDRTILVRHRHHRP